MEYVILLFLVCLSLFSVLMLMQVFIPRKYKRKIAKKFGWHSWRYRNPYDRTCDVCGRHEVEHCYDLTDKYGFWEVFHEGRRGHKCSADDSLIED